VCHHPKLEEGRTASDFGHGVSEDIGRMKNYLLPVAMVLLAASPWAKADIVVSLGNTSPGFTNGQHPLTQTPVLAAQSGQPAPFNAACGADGGAGGSTNCSAPSMMFCRYNSQHLVRPLGGRYCDDFARASGSWLGRDRPQREQWSQSYIFNPRPPNHPAYGDPRTSAPSTSDRRHGSHRPGAEAP